MNRRLILVKYLIVTSLGRNGDSPFSFHILLFPSLALNVLSSCVTNTSYPAFKIIFFIFFHACYPAFVIYHTCYPVFILFITLAPLRSCRTCLINPRKKKGKRNCDEVEEEKMGYDHTPGKEERHESGKWEKQRKCDEPEPGLLRSQNCPVAPPPE